jgi:WD40 repeat protein
MSRFGLPMMFVLAAATAGSAQQPMREFKGYGAVIRSVALSADGERVAAGGTASDVVIWDLAGGKEVQRLKGRSGWAISVAFAPDGKTLAQTNWGDGTVGLWDLAGGKEKFVLSKHANPEVHHVAYSLDGKRVVSTGYDGSVRVWNSESGKEEQKLMYHVGGSYVGVFSPDGKRVASGGRDGKVRTWDVTTGKSLWESRAAESFLTAMAFSPDGKKVYSGGHDGTMREWDSATGKELRKWVTDRGAARTFALSPDGRTLAVANERGSVQLWELETLKLRRLFASDKGFTWAVAFAPDGKSIITGGDDTIVRQWDVTDGWGSDNPKRPVLKEADLERYWKDLGSNDGSVAFTAVWALASAPKQGLPLLGKRLKTEKPTPIDEKRINDLIKKLDDDSFEVREKAGEELIQAGAAIRDMLAAALKESKSPEQRTRLESLLTKIGDDRLTPEELRVLRGKEVLEKIGGDEARGVLKELALEH